MRTTPAEKIRDYRARGWWGDTRIHDLFDVNARANPERLALVDAPNRADLVGTPANRLSFAAAASLADGYSLSLARLGLGKDDVLVTQLPNIAEYPLLYIAAMRLGIVVSPVPVQFRRHELEQIVRLTNAKAILTIDQLKGTDQIGIALALSSDLAKDGLTLQVLSLRSATSTTQTPRGATAFEAAALDAESIAELHNAVKPPPLMPTTSPRSAGRPVPKVHPKAYRAPTIIGMRSVSRICAAQGSNRVKCC